MTDDAFDAVARFVEQQLNFATSHYNDAYLDRRFSSRMRRTDSADYEEYLEVLRTDSTEQSALLDALSINVTEFFRNPAVWDELRSVLRTLTTEHLHVNIWSAACADGREPYSLALLAHADREINESRVSILGTDINEEALAAAEAGVYESSRTVDLDAQLSYLDGYTAYVSRDGDTFQMDDQLRNSVTFERHDLINGEPKDGYDMVLCRNLFIYINSKYKVPVLETVIDSLKPGGYLVIGKAETVPPELQTNLTAVDSRLRIYQVDK